MDPQTVFSILGGAGTLGWTGKELLRQSREIKTLKAERDAAETLADQRHTELLIANVLNAKTSASIEALNGRITALTETVERQTVQITGLETQLQRQTVQIAELKTQLAHREADGHG